MMKLHASCYHVLHGVAMTSNEKKCRKLLFRFDKPVREWYFESVLDMANQPAKDKKFVSILLKRELVKKLEKLAAHRGKSRTDVIATLLEEGTRDVELTVEDYEAIIREIKEAGLR